MKKLIIALVVAGLLAGLGWGGVRGYKSWRQTRLIQQARIYLAKADGPNAVLCLQQAVRSNPSDVEACKLFASLAELAQSPNAIFWRQRVAQLEPKVADHYLDWARTALALSDLTAANEALMAVPTEAKGGAEYHKLVAALAWGLKQFPEAELHYVESLRLEPENLTSHLNLATIRLASTDVEKQHIGRSSLRSLSTNAPVRAEALRELVADGIRRRDWPQALADVTELNRAPDANFADQIFRLNVLASSGDPSLDNSLSLLLPLASTNATSASALGTWMVDRGRTSEAIRWLSQLSPGLRTNAPVAMVIAEAQQKLEDWAGLQAFVRHQNWGRMEYVRFAISARASGALGNKAAQSVEWRKALKQCNNRPELIADLGKRAGNWGWKAEVDESLWALFAANPKDQTTFTLLYNRLFAEGNTRGLQALLAQSVESRPKDNDLINNLALVSLLNNPSDTRGHSLARDVYTQNPKNPNFLSTYAYSLHLQRKSTEALRLLEGLTPAELEQPAVAVYYGIILAAAGNGEKAKLVLNRASVARMLPEERATLTRVLSGT